MDWEYSLFQITTSFTGKVALGYVLLPSEVNAQYTDPTLMATRLVAGFTFAAVPQGAAAAVGLIRWDDINDTVPAPADTPGPISNGNMDWIIRQVFVGLPVGGGSTSTAPGDHTVLAKSRRRMGSDSGLLCVVETVAGVTFGGGAVDVRCLIKE